MADIRPYVAQDIAQGIFSYWLSTNYPTIPKERYKILVLSYPTRKIIQHFSRWLNENDMELCYERLHGCGIKIVSNSEKSLALLLRA